MKKSLMKGIVITLLYIIILIELIVVFHVFRHYIEVSKEANTHIDIGTLQPAEEPTTPIGDVEKVRERNRFYTTVSCVNRYLNNLYMKDSKTVYEYLDPLYVEQNGITQDNVLQKLKVLDSKVVFTAEKMYEQKITDVITQYYAYGKIKVDATEDTNNVGEDFYISIRIDREEGTFTVLPDTYIN